MAQYFNQRYCERVFQMARVRRPVTREEQEDQSLSKRGSTHRYSSDARCDNEKAQVYLQGGADSSDVVIGQVGVLHQLRLVVSQLSFPVQWCPALRVAGPINSPRRYLVASHVQPVGGAVVAVGSRDLCS